MVSGGAEFGVPEGVLPGPQVADGTSFTLHRNHDEAVKSTFAPVVQFLLLFDQSVRGLVEGAPVEFRGIPIGRVIKISFDLNPVRGDRRIPVLVAIDPSLLRKESSEQIKDPDSGFLEEAVGRGLRASLKTGSLLTGALFVDLDYHADAAPAGMSLTGDLRTIPTVSSGFAQMEAKLTAILDKIQALPLDETMKKFATAADESSKTIVEARGALKEIEGAAAAARATLEDPQFKDLPGDLKKTLAELEKSVASVGPDGAIQGDLLRTLDELRYSLRSFKAMTTTIGEKPNSLLFGKDTSGNPIPKAPRKK
jgi:paraquat-inducible protein B